jgi:hypothetical protein
MILMNPGQRISAFASLGESISKILSARETEELHASQASMKLYKLIQTVHFSNPWFIEEYVRLSLKSVSELITYDNLNNWFLEYPELQHEKSDSHKIAVISAGNIPLVGFHDFLCILIAGDHYHGKLSSRDNQLPRAIAELLIEIEPEFSAQISFTEDKLDSFDAVIATGSNNSSRYFEYYFEKYPHIIRKNRSSLAILDGYETADELRALADDIFLYFGMGCRNVSKVYVPEGYSFNFFFENMEGYSWLINHNKYMNNHQYSRVIYLVNSDEHLDNNFLLVKKDRAISSPIAVLHFEPYDNIFSLAKEIETKESEIQCLISHTKTLLKSMPFGKAQYPELMDYADGIDTMKFLLQLKKAFR